MGWGAAQAGETSNLNANNNFGTTAANAYGGVYDNVNTAGAAAIQRGKGAGSTMNTKSGLRTYFDIKKVDKDALTGPALIVEVEKGDGSIPTSNAVSGGQFTLTNGTQSGYMRALSKANVYFARPSKLWKRADNKTELGSLYSPYWQVRLAPSGFGEQFASMTYHLW
jgi:hypothetical protein